jgi:hypothetical protein
MRGYDHPEREGSFELSQRYKGKDGKAMFKGERGRTAETSARNKTLGG